MKTKIESFPVPAQLGIPGLIATLKRAQRSAEMALSFSTPGDSFAAIVHVESESSGGFQVLVVDLYEETLTDGSKAYSVSLV